MKKLIITGVFIILGLGLATSATAGDAAAGKAAYALCSSCHGANGEGNKALNAPSIAGQEEWYLARQLKNFKVGARGLNPKDTYGAQMRPMSMTLPTDQAVDNIAAYIASLKPTVAAATISGDAAAGKGAYALCSSCHGPQGQGNKSLNAPALKGQPDWYVARQLQNYKAGIRGTDPKDTFGAQMRPMAMTLPTDQAVNNVAAYIATFK